MNEMQKKLILKGLEVLKSQIMRSRTKEGGDEDMVSIYNKKIGEIDSVVNFVMTKELFNEPVAKK